jgi:hypothetical protein
LQLDSGEPLAVHPRHPNHRRGQVALRVKTLVLVHCANTVQAKRLDRVRAIAGNAPRKPNERSLPTEPGLEVCGRKPERSRQAGALGRAAALQKRARACVNRTALGRERQRLAVPIDAN